MRRLWGMAARPGLEVGLLSLARGNGKTAACATVAAATFLHECSTGGGDVSVFASSFSQAQILGRDAARLIEDGSEFARRDSGQRFEIEHRPSGARLRCLGSDSGRAMGLRSRLILMDEPASWKAGSGYELFVAARTSLGKVEGGRVLVLGTRASDPGHWWERLLREPPAASEMILHAAAADCDLGDRREWHRANPSLRSLNIPRMETLANEAADAADDPAAAASFRNLRLNAGTPLVSASALFDAATWAALPVAGPREGPLVLGVDLGGSSSLSAVAAYWPVTGRVECLALVGDTPPLRARGRAMGQATLFERLAAGGELLVSGGRAPNPGVLLDAAAERFGEPNVLVADSYRAGELFDHVGVAPWAAWCQVVVRRGNDRPDDLARAQQRVAAGLVRPVRSELLDRSVAAARTKVGSDGVVRLLHDWQAIDDVAAALVLAAASGDRMGLAPPPA